MKKVRKGQPGQSLIDSIDRSVNHCLNIMVLAELLRCCDTAHLKSQTLANAGYLVFAEAEKLLEELKNFSK